MFKKYNPNPKGKEVGDCVVRALCCAFNQPWDVVYTTLCKVGLELKCMPNEKESYSALIENSGFKRYSMPKATKGSSRTTAGEFARTHKEGTYILKLANHIVCCKNGVLYDLWDCSDSCVYTYWKNEKK